MCETFSSLMSSFLAFLEEISQYHQEFQSKHDGHARERIPI